MNFFTLAPLIFMGHLKFGSVVLAKEMPPPPEYYVFDEAAILSSEARERIQSLLIEHDQLTGEQIIISLFKSLDGEDLVEWTGRVFKDWRIGQRGKDNGVLLAVYWNDQKARIEVGYGLESLLTENTVKNIVEKEITPALTAREPDSAIAAPTISILEAIGSPLSADGKSVNRLSAIKHVPRQEPVSLKLPILLLLFAFVFLVFVLNQLLKAEAHFTSSGWFRSNPIKGGVRLLGENPPARGGGTSGSW